MSFVETSIKAILANKKDKNYIEIKSYYSFLEVFILSENKSAGIRIPDTILIEHGGNIRCWMFNSKKDDDTPILKKRQDKLTTNEIMAFFSKNTTTGTSMKTKYGTGFFSEKIAKIREYNKPQAIVRYINDQIDLLNLTDLQDYLQTGLSYLKMIQANLDIKSKSEYNSGETYYCEYRQDDNLLPPSYRFVKKVQQFSKPEENISSSCYKSKLLYKGSTKPEETAYSDTMNTPGTITVKETKPRTNLITENSKKFYKVFDVATNQRLEKLTKIFATYMAQSFRVIVKKLVCKFAIDEQNEFYFMGVKELLIEFRDKALAASIDLKEMSLEEMINTTKRHSKEQEAAILLNIDDAPKKKISKIIKEECHGDFCEFISLDSMKLAELASGHNVAKYLKKDKTSERRLPYEITYNLVRRCKQDPEEIKTIFKYHKIFPRYYAELVNDSPQALNHVDFDVKFRKMEHDNFQTLYRFVKVCKNCYPIYVTLQRALTEGETKPIAYPSYRPLTQNMEQSPSHAAYHKMSMTAMSPQTKTSNFNAIDSFKGRTMDVLSEEKKVINITKAKENNARENLKDIVTGGAGGAPRQPYAKSTDAMSRTSKLHRSVQTSQQKERQKTVTQRLILGVSAQSQKFPGVLAPSAEASNRQEHVSRQENKSPASPARLHMSMSLYDKEIFSPKGLTVSVAAGTQEKEEKKDQVDEIHKKALRRIASNVTKVTALDPFSSNKRKSIIKLSGHNKGEKPLLPLTTLYLLAKNLNIHTVLFELKRLLQKRRETRRADKDATSLFHHDLFDSARRIPPFLTTTPKQKMSLDFRMQQKPVLDLQRICNLGGYEPPRNYEDLIKIFVVDEHTAIPYAVITSEIDAFKCNDVVVVCHDLFNNFIEDIDYFMSLASQTKNIKFVLFNLPGQAYTLYKEDHIYNNDFNAALVDSLLEDLAKQDKIDPRIDVFKFIGIGFGANILLYYNSMASDNLFSKSYVFAINPFINVDDILEQSLEKAKEIILETPEHMKEMTNLYFSLNFGNGRLSEQEAYDRMMTNPITKSGRLTVINGILNSFNIHQAVATANCPMVILHTYQNAVASNSHVYNLCHYKGQSFKSPHTTLEDFMADPNGKRLVLHSKGSYLAFEEREPEVLKLIETFLISTQDQNNLLEWIFNEKMLSQIEHDILNLQELELEEVQGYIEKLSDIKKVSKEVRQMFLSEAETFVSRVNEKFRELESKIQKCDENLNSLKKNSQDKLTNKQVSQKNLEKVKAMHEERFQVIQEHMKNIRDHNKEPLNLLLTLAKDLDNIDDKTAAILKASTGKVLDQHSNDLMGLITKNQWDFHRLREILETKEESSDVLGEAQAELKQVFSDLLDIETTYKNIPSIPLFDHNLSILKAKSIELEIQSIQLRIKLVQISEQVLKYFNKMDIDDKETAKHIEEALEFYSDELVIFMDLLNIGDPVFIKTNTTSDDPNHTNNPGQLYISSKADLETNFGPNVIKKRIEEFKHRVERIIEERKPPASQDFKNRLEDLIAKVDEANDSMSK